MDIVKLFHMCFFMHIYCFHIYLNSIVTVAMMLCVRQYRDATLTMLQSF